MFKIVAKRRRVSAPRPGNFRHDHAAASIATAIAAWSKRPHGRLYLQGARQGVCARHSKVRNRGARSRIVLAMPRCSGSLRHASAARLAHRRLGWDVRGEPAGPPISEDTRRFILKSIDSVRALEALLLIVPVIGTLQPRALSQFCTYEPRTSGTPLPKISSLSRAVSRYRNRGKRCGG
jgi:hypothetical protein